jgi:glycosidase
MRWNASRGGGFCDPAVSPWLPIGPAEVNVADQRDDPRSVLSLCRRLIDVRRAELGGGLANYERLPAAPGVWAYSTRSLVVAANFSPTPAALPAQLGEILLRTGSGGPGLGPVEGVIARRQAD